MTSDRRTRQLALSATVVIAIMIGASCSSDNDYARSDVGPDSPHGKQVAALIAQLPAAADAVSLDAYLDAHAAPELTGTQRQSLRHALAQLAQSPQKQLRSCDRFGDRIYRAVIRRSDSPSDTQAMLLVEVDGELKWAGTN